MRFFVSALAAASVAGTFPSIRQADVAAVAATLDAALAALKRGELPRAGAAPKPPAKWSELRARYTLYDIPSRTAITDIIS